MCITVTGENIRYVGSNQMDREGDSIWKEAEHEQEPRESSFESETEIDLVEIHVLSRGKESGVG